jgi:hypothetical protein
MSNCIVALQCRAIAEAVNRYLPTGMARVRAQVWQVGFVVGKVVLVQVYSEYFGFLCQKPFIPPTSPSSQSLGADTQRPCDELITRPRSPAD